MTNYYKSIICVFILLITIKTNAQSKDLNVKDKDTTSIGKLFIEDGKNAVLSAKHAFLRPLSWDKKDFTTLGTVAVSAFALATVDDETSAYFTRQKPPKIFQEVGTRFGSPQVYFIANAGLYGFGLFTKNEKIRKTSVLIISSSFTTGVIQSLSKTVFGRARPGNGLKSNEFHLWSNEPAHHSFPSGHTVLSITMAHSIAKQFNNTWSKVGVYTLGSIAPISRLFAGAHWLTDVGIGAVLSIVVVDSIDKFLYNSNAYDYGDNYKKKNRISWNVSFTGNQIGLIGTF
ncbi:phosphatase PAP2 family protein [Lacinutrix sp. 5H-3-7-4]|uniref:phosphatase PAP2 family protein n=1 Tax=Lacinutrix sp. (strain 5H-3-7-4) TaxID=983544 RepID=UPI00020A3B2C|nr:phosphatase PAP2 family protein [Lacinutrix sp. 5H-3-7-4]AEH02757.1 phosphoesterase PA-phosphatase related protein [Lacinutrix sp. 5H-3-7-4]